MIQEDYVSFETAKLLKEKGFDGKCDCLYADGIITRAQGGRHDWNKGETLFSNYKNECSAPTLQMTMKWLREEYNIIVYVKPLEDGNCYVSRILYNGIDHLVEGGAFGTYEKACEVAIQYCLEKLI